MSEAATPTIRLFFVGTYAEIRDVPPGNRTYVFNRFGQEFTTSNEELAKSLVSYRPGADHRDSHFVTEDEFRQVLFPDGKEGFPTAFLNDPDLADKKKRLLGYLHTVADVNPSTFWNKQPEPAIEPVKEVQQ